LGHTGTVPEGKNAEATIARVSRCEQYRICESFRRIWQRTYVMSVRTEGSSGFGCWRRSRRRVSTRRQATIRSLRLFVHPKFSFMRKYLIYSTAERLVFSQFFSDPPRETRDSTTNQGVIASFPIHYTFTITLSRSHTVQSY